MTQLIQRSNGSIEALEAEIEALEKEAGIINEEVEEEEVVEEKAVEPQPLSKEEETFKKRYADLRRLQQKQADELKELKAKLASGKTQELPIDKESAEKWARENPKAASVIRALVLEQMDTKVTPDMDRLKTMQEEVEKEREQARIRKAHPDFDDIVALDEFHTWAESQPKRVQDLIYDGTADDVIWAIGAYKKETSTPTKEHNKAAEAVVKGGSKTAPKEDSGKTLYRESEVAKMSLTEYAKHEEAISKAIREGRFSYDLSGAAR